MLSPPREARIGSSRRPIAPDRIADCRREQYEGGYSLTGELEGAPELARYYPDFASLLDAGFTDWAEKLYGPMLQLPVAELGKQEAGV